MPIFTKLLLFFLVPALLLGILAMPSMRKDKTQGADAWATLSETAAYQTPRGWRVEDPLTATTAGLDVRWSMDWPTRRAVHAATFFHADGAQVTVFVGKKATLEPLALDANAYYQGNVMIERLPTETWKTKDGVELRVETARYVPGPLTGRATTMLLAWGARGQRFVLVNAGGEGDSLSPPAVQELLGKLTLGR